VRDHRQGQGKGTSDGSSDREPWYSRLFDRDRDRDRDRDKDTSDRDTDNKPVRDGGGRFLRPQ
jgi:hypothetical protein